MLRRGTHTQTDAAAAAAVHLPPSANNEQNRLPMYERPFECICNHLFFYHFNSSSAHPNFRPLQRHKIRSLHAIIINITAHTAGVAIRTLSTNSPIKCNRFPHEYDSSCVYQPTFTIQHRPQRVEQMATKWVHGLNQGWMNRLLFVHQINIPKNTCP